MLRCQCPFCPSVCDGSALWSLCMPRRGEESSRAMLVTARPSCSQIFHSNVSNEQRRSRVFLLRHVKSRVKSHQLYQIDSPNYGYRTQQLLRLAKLFRLCCGRTSKRVYWFQRTASWLMIEIRRLWRKSSLFAGKPICLRSDLSAQLFAFSSPSIFVTSAALWRVIGSLLRVHLLWGKTWKCVVVCRTLRSKQQLHNMLIFSHV